MTCTNCAKPINRGRWCSDKCRMSYKRTFEDNPAPIHNPNKVEPEQNPNTICPTCDYANYDPNDEWSHSACHKTQLEIEAHYTLKNFPRLKYGSGAGSYSPYPKSNPKSKAYLDV